MDIFGILVQQSSNFSLRPTSFIPYHPGLFSHRSMILFIKGITTGGFGGGVRIPQLLAYLLFFEGWTVRNQGFRWWEISSWCLLLVVISQVCHSLHVSYITVDKNDCLSSPCQNNKTCVELIRGYFCGYKYLEQCSGDQCRIGN